MTYWKEPRVPFVHVTQLTPEAALAFERRIRNLGPEIGLGWEPYNYLVTVDAVSTWACHKDYEFDNWLKRNQFNAPMWSQWENGIRSAILTKEVI